MSQQLETVPLISRRDFCRMPEVTFLNEKIYSLPVGDVVRIEAQEALKEIARFYGCENYVQ